MNIPEKLYITDTTFRDGQQCSPYTVEEISKLFDLHTSWTTGAVL